MENDTQSHDARFPLTDLELDFTRKLSNLIRANLSRWSPKDLKSAAVLLLGLERLPMAAAGVNVEAAFREPDVTPGNYGWAELRLTEERLELGIGEHFYDPDVGGDTETRTLFSVWASGKSAEGDIEEWFEYASGHVSRGYFTIADDDSELERMDWEVD